MTLNIGPYDNSTRTAINDAILSAVAATSGESATIVGSLLDCLNTIYDDIPTEQCNPNADPDVLQHNANIVRNYLAQFASTLPKVLVQNLNATVQASLQDDQGVEAEALRDELQALWEQASLGSEYEACELQFIDCVVATAVSGSASTVGLWPVFFILGNFQADIPYRDTVLLREQGRGVPETPCYVARCAQRQRQSVCSHHFRSRWSGQLGRCEEAQGPSLRQEGIHHGLLSVDVIRCAAGRLRVDCLFVPNLTTFGLLLMPASRVLSTVVPSVLALHIYPLGTAMHRCYRFDVLASPTQSSAAWSL